MTTDLEPLRALHAAMIAAHQAYCRSPAEEVHYYHAAFKAARFAFNRACGEYVAGLLEVEL